MRGKETKTFIIAEAGVNHNGSLELAKALVDAAASAGTDAVKFQTFKAETLLSKYAPKARYQLATTNPVESQFEMIKKLELSYAEQKTLANYCKTRRILFLSSAFDLESLDFLKTLNVQILKIPSGEITNLPYLRKVGSFGKRIFLSTGMSTLEEIGKALEVLSESGTSKQAITVLHCNTEYPTPITDVNLRAMQTIQDTFNVNVGYSDHTLGIEVAISATALGAKVIEKHFTLDKTMEGPDHKASLEPDEFKKMVKAIRNIEQALGNGIKQPSLSEKKNIPVVRKSIVASRDIRKNELFGESNIAVKRPGTGINPMQWDNVIGKTATRDFKQDDLIEL